MRLAMRRISWTGRRIRDGDGACGSFLGRCGIGMSADDGRHDEGRHDQGNMAVPAVPRARLVVVEAKLVLRGLETVPGRPSAPLDPYQCFQRRALRTTRVEKKARSPSAMLRRISRPRIQSPLKAASKSAASRSASSIQAQSWRRSPSVPEPADKRCQASGGMSAAMSFAVPATA